VSFGKSREIAAIKAMLEARDAGGNAKVIEAVPDPREVPALSAPPHSKRRRKVE
jgi:hypothetical protein